MPVLVDRLVFLHLRTSVVFVIGIVTRIADMMLVRNQLDCSPIAVEIRRVGKGAAVVRMVNAASHRDVRKECDQRQQGNSLAIHATIPGAVCRGILAFTGKLVNAKFARKRTVVQDRLRVLEALL